MNGLTRDSSYTTNGAGGSGTSNWYYYVGSFVGTPGINQVTVNLDPDQSVAETSYTDNTMSSTFTAVSPVVGNMSYTVEQLRAAYGIGNIPTIAGSAADGTGQTIAIVDAYNDPNIVTDLDGFDNGMSMSTTASPTLFPLYGAASSFLTIYNQTGTNITSTISTSGSNGVPVVDSTGGWEGEETLDVDGRMPSLQGPRST